MVMESVTSRKAYQNIITNRTYAFAKFEKWQVILNDLFDFDEYLVCYRDITFITNVPKYRSFQYRLMSQAIITNVHLYRWKKRGMNVCSFCGLEKETYVHSTNAKQLLDISAEQIDTVMNVETIKGEVAKCMEDVFIGYNANVTQHEQIQMIYCKLKLLHPAARHIICAFRIPGVMEHEDEDYCDDGE